MSRFRLRSYDQTPPGGYVYEQTEGIRRKFPSQPLIEAQAQFVASFRQGNGLPRSSVREALEDVDCYTCQRLGNMHAWCISTDPVHPDVALNTSSRVVSAGCAGCGVKL